MLWLGLLLLGVVIMVGMIAFSRPNRFQIERSVTIQASSEVIFGLINDLQQWSRWHPQQGHGPRLEIMQSISPTRVVVAAHWQKPFVALNLNDFEILPSGEVTTVRWSLSGPNLFVMKLMSVFVNMDRMMGQHFEKALTALKTAAESNAS